LLGAVAAVTAGCSSDRGGPDLATIEPAAAAVAPPVAAPSGVIGLVGVGIGAVLAEPASGRIAVVESAGTALPFVDPAAPDSARTLPLPGPGAGRAAGVPGEVLVAMPGAVLRVDVGTATMRRVPIDGEVRAVALLSDEVSLVVGTADGRVRVIAPGGEVA